MIHPCSPGGLPALGCPEYSLYTISSIMAAAFGALNIMWSVILYSGLDDVRAPIHCSTHSRTLTATPCAVPARWWAWQ